MTQHCEKYENKYKLTLVIDNETGEHIGNFCNRCLSKRTDDPKLKAHFLWLADNDLVHNCPQEATHA